MRYAGKYRYIDDPVGAAGAYGGRLHCADKILNNKACK